MQTVTVNKADLIDKITTNREEHRDIFLKAQKKYRERVIEKLDQRLTDAREGRPIVLHFGLPEPVDYTGEYDTALAQLGWEINDQVELDEQSFRQLVLNQWHWAKHFETNTTSYLAE